MATTAAAVNRKDSDGFGGEKKLRNGETVGKEARQG